MAKSTTDKKTFPPPPGVLPRRGAPTRSAQDNGSRFSVEKLDCMIDLHLHLDGAISLESAKQLAQMQGITRPQSDAELMACLRVSENCTDLNEFLEKFTFPCSLIQTKEGVRQAFANLMDELKEQGVMYAEVRFAPQKSTDKGLTQEDAVTAALEGMRSVPMDAGLILCCMRGDDTRAQNLETISIAEKYLGQGVVAVDLAGAEAIYPNSDYEDIFALAAQKGIPVILHAGEADGPASVKKALEMGAVRIGHGIRAIEDEALLRELAEKQIPLELCPTSNVNTAIFRSIAHWPLEKLMASGVYITINTDDPAIEGTSIKDEYRKLIRAFGIGKAEVKSFLINSVNASFTSPAWKRKMLEKIEAAFEK